MPEQTEAEKDQIDREAAEDCNKVLAALGIERTEHVALEGVNGPHYVLSSEEHVIRAGRGLMDACSFVLAAVDDAAFIEWCIFLNRRRARRRETMKVGKKQ